MAKGIIVEQKWQHSTQYWEDKEIHTFPKGTSPKGNLTSG